ncbi:hypothetical protein [Ekhidna sp.]
MKRTVLALLGTLVVINLTIAQALTDTGSKVGIGTTTPSEILHIEKSGNTFLKLVNSSSNGSTVNFGPVSSNGYKETQIQFENEFGLYDHAQSKWRFKIQDDGSIGIGTHNPRSPIDIRVSAMSGVFATFLSEAGISDGAELHRWTIRTGRNYDYPNRTLDFGMVSDGYGTNPAFYVAPKGVEVFRITESGKVGIGTTDFSGDHKLRVEGSIGAREIKVEASGWSDFVFEKDYELLTLEEVEEHIVEKGYLPEIPSEAEVNENGINLGQMNAKLLQKIEELTLYMIDMNKRMNQLETENSELKEKVQHLKNQ